MFLFELAPDQIRDDAARSLTVFGATDDSRDVRFGFVFFAIPGARHSGLEFIKSAAENGAQAVVVPEGTRTEDLALSPYEASKLIILRHHDVRGFYARTISRFFPHRPGTIVAVTGTNGKTSTVSFLRDIWAHNGQNAKSIGTLGLRAGPVAHTNLEASMTTFDAKTLHIMLSELAIRHAVTHVVMEVSSHALDQRRVDGVEFDAAAFTNLTQDHLDYHQTMEAYGAAKARLFSDRLKAGGFAVLNADDPWSVDLAAICRSRSARVIQYGQKAETADLRVLSQVPTHAGQTLRLDVFGRRHDVQTPMAGSFQGGNALCALGLAIATGVAADVAVGALEHLSHVPGRCELVATLRSGAAVYVDYAHTPDALENVLKSLRPHAKRELHVLFGCGGDRDSQKRPMMGQIAARLADRVSVTDDNPRSEDGRTIRNAILAAIPNGIDAGDRADAIERALTGLQDGDVLVIAGKGHEDYQILPDPIPADPKHTRKVSFSDRTVVQMTVEKLNL